MKNNSYYKIYKIYKLYNMNYNWITLSFLATFITAIGTISLKIIDNSKYDNNIFLALTFIFMGFFFIFNFK
tara:strand:+ start:9997 stop:10209 length:213 start_codon:yes stop_codon:yes gene_type:complete